MIYKVGECTCAICSFGYVGILPVEEGQEWEPPLECPDCGNRTAYFKQEEPQ